MLWALVSKYLSIFAKINVCCEYNGPLGAQYK